MKLQDLQNVEAEKLILSTLIQHPEQLPEVQGTLKQSDFYRETHKVIYGALLDMVQARDVVELPLLAEHMRKNGTLEKVGGLPVLTDIFNLSATSCIDEYIKTVKEYGRRRSLLAIGERLKQEAGELEHDPEDAATNAQEALSRTMAERAENSLYGMKQSIMDYIKLLEKRQAGEVQGLHTGFYDLDKLTGGIQSTDLVILAARPSMGKSALAANIAANVCKAGGSVLYFSLEMSRNQMIDRLTAAESTINVKRLQEMHTNEREWNAAFKAADELSKYRLEIDESGALCPCDVLSKAVLMKAKTGLDLIVIDHLQLMDTDKDRRNAGDRVQQITYITRRLKSVAMALSVPVLALSQLNRSVESREDKRPGLADLRESGSIEQDADMVWTLYRPGYYTRDMNDRRAELGIVKNRSGELGTVDLVWLSQFTLFQSASKIRP